MLGCIGSGAKLCFASVLTLKIKNHASSHVIKINTMEIGNLLSGEGNGKNWLFYWRLGYNWKELNFLIIVNRLCF